MEILKPDGILSWLCSGWEPNQWMLGQVHVGKEWLLLLQSGEMAVGQRAREPLWGSNMPQVSTDRDGFHELCASAQGGQACDDEDTMN